MRKLAIFAAAATMIGMSGVASAADLGGYKDAPVYAPSFSWTGFYLGGHAGGGWGDSSWDYETSKFSNTSSSLSGGLGGIQAGYNLQLRTLVLGLEGSVSWASLEGSSDFVNPGNGLIGTNHTQLNWVGDASLRAGLALDRTLLFAKTGVAWGGFDHSRTGNNGFSATAATDNQVGWLIGGGAEFALNNNWSVKVEYNYIDFGKGNFNINRFETGADQSASIVKAGINYKFGGAGLTSLK
jgi:outer membrane immunogenic protein